MSDPNFIILYVNNPAVSANFYKSLLGKDPVDNSPNFAMFALDSGVMLGLWAKQEVQPETHISGGGAELAFTLADNQAVEVCYADWSSKHIPIVQTPTQMDFGYTFVGLDPDGHRLRIFTPAMP